METSKTGITCSFGVLHENTKYFIFAIFSTTLEQGGMPTPPLPLSSLNKIAYVKSRRANIICPAFHQPDHLRAGGQALTILIPHYDIPCSQNPPSPA